MLRYLFVVSSLALAFVLCVGVPSARADTITTFQLAGTFANGSTLGGTLVLNITTGSFVSSAVTVSGIGTFDVFQFLNMGVLGCTPGDTCLGIQHGFPPNFSSLGLTFEASSLVGYSGGQLRGSGASDSSEVVTTVGGVTTVSLLTSGSATPVVVPEPQSLLLFGTGLLGMVGALRRKWLG